MIYTYLSLNDKEKSKRTPQQKDLLKQPRHPPFKCQNRTIRNLTLWKFKFCDSDNVVSQRKWWAVRLHLLVRSTRKIPNCSFDRITSHTNGMTTNKALQISWGVLCSWKRAVPVNFVWLATLWTLYCFQFCICFRAHGRSKGSVLERV